MAVDGGRIVLGGTFTALGGISATRIGSYTVDLDVTPTVSVNFDGTDVMLDGSLSLNCAPDASGAYKWVKASRPAMAAFTESSTLEYVRSHTFDYVMTGAALIGTSLSTAQGRTPLNLSVDSVSDTACTLSVRRADAFERVVTSSGYDNLSSTLVDSTPAFAYNDAGGLLFYHAGLETRLVSGTVTGTSVLQRTGTLEVIVAFIMDARVKVLVRTAGTWGAVTTLSNVGSFTFDGVYGPSLLEIGADVVIGAQHEKSGPGDTYPQTTSYSSDLVTWTAPLTVNGSPFSVGRSAAIEFGGFIHTFTSDVSALFYGISSVSADGSNTFVATSPAAGPISLVSTSNVVGTFCSTTGTLVVFVAGVTAMVVYEVSGVTGVVSATIAYTDSEYTITYDDGKLQTMTTSDPTTDTWVPLNTLVVGGGPTTSLVRVANRLLYTEGSELALMKLGLPPVTYTLLTTVGEV